MKVPPSDLSKNDTQLIEESLSGQSDAFGQLIQKHQKTLIDLAMRMLRNTEEAEDVVQQVFIEAYRHLADFRRDAQFSTWLYSITLNRVRNHLRSRKIRACVPLEWAPEESGEVRSLQLSDPTPGVDQQLEKQLDLEWIQREVKLLPEDYQDIFILHYFRNLPLQEVAEKLGRPLGTVKVYLHRARKAIYQKRQQSQSKKES